MPQIFKIGPYFVYFWANEGLPIEPIHVHIAGGKPKIDGTKVWITKAGKCLLANNNSRIPNHVLNNLLRIIETRTFEIIRKWEEMFGRLDFYC